IHEVPGGRRRDQSARRESRRTRSGSPLATLSSHQRGTEPSGVGRPKQQLLAACITSGPPHSGSTCMRVTTLLVGMRGKLREGTQSEAAILEERRDTLGLEATKESRGEHVPRRGELKR
ncbi:MAG: hypothetical protein WCP98_17160, partial [Actinomycetes bacterium]